VLNGMWQERYPGGRAAVSGQHQAGRRVGTWYQFDRNGAQMHTATYSAEAALP